MTSVSRTVTDLANSIEQLLTKEISKGLTPTLPEIQRIGNALRGIFPDVSAEMMNEAEKLVQARVNVFIQAANAVSRDHTPWVNTSQAVRTPYYWDRYATFLANNGKAHIVRSLEREALRILDLTSDPAVSTSWDRRGLVLGNVQSGKTANYTGLVCRAADAGFKVIIIIAGIHNNLRNQTQERIDEGFIGSQKVLGNKAQSQKNVGVGLINSERKPTHFTSKVHDFTKTLADSVGMSLTGMKEPGVFVIKKNATTLRSLKKFLHDNGSRDGGKINESLLLIDDEADNASINVARGDKISTINGLIRNILDLFERSAYIGYTATPFANIFIDPKTTDDMFKEDLFPRSFIVSLEAPSNYFGARTVFLDEPEKYLRVIDDFEDDLPLKHKIDTQLEKLPPSLLHALHTYVLARAVRVLRHQGSEHSSMLVNVSRFNDVQFQVQDLLGNELSNLMNAIRMSSGLGDKALKDPTLASLSETFNLEYPEVGISWEELIPVLWDAVAPIEVLALNNKSSASLNYDNYRDQGRHIIAIGGYSLSRGLTLEGLSTTYFLRNSVMYDTLLQMGRWFGYRPGYQDLCRIWLTEDAIDWYSHIAIAVEELRDDLRRMDQVGGTPEDFGLKVRSHPDNLIITARNKLGTGQSFPVSVSLGGKLRETATIHYSEDPLSGANFANLEIAKTLLKEMERNGITPVDNTKKAAKEWPTGYIFKKVPKALVLQFIDAFQLHDNMSFRFKEITRDYIVKRGTDFSHWDVYVPGLLTAKTPAGMDSPIGISLNLRTRGGVRNGQSTSQEGILVTSKSRVGDAIDESAGLTAEQVSKVPVSEQGSASGQNYRIAERDPLLILHFLAVKHPVRDRKDTQPNTDDLVQEYRGPYVAYGISFPNVGAYQRDAQVTYTVNETYRDVFAGRFETDDQLTEEELGEDDL